MIVGVTGLPCAGKSLVAEMIASGGVDGVPALLLRADDIGHEVLLRPDVLEALRGRFGAEAAAGADPAAMRRAIAERVFSDPAELAWLEGLVHPLVSAEVFRRCAAAEGRAVVEAALLFAAGMDARCGRILVVEAEFGVRLARAALRGWDGKELLRREERLIPLFAAAWNSADSGKMARIDNSGSVGDLRNSVRAALEA